MSTREWLLCAALLWTAFGCGSHSTDVKIPERPVPTTFEGGAVGRSVGTLSWRSFFPDPSLQSLIAGTLGANPDLKIAFQRVELARAGVRQTTGALAPQVAVGVGAGLKKPGRYTAEGAGNAGTEITPGRPVPSPVPQLALGLDSSWEVDIWGKLRSARRAALSRYLASVEGTRFVTSALVAEVAAAYFELLALDHTQQVLQQTVLRQQEALEVVRLQMQAGRANELAVQQFAAQLASTRAMAVEVEVEIRETESRLNLLRGSFSAKIERSQDSLLIDVAPRFATGVPSEMLRNRPDVRQAEAEIEAAKFDLASARAAFFPSLTLSAAVGFEAFNPRYLLSTPESLAYSASAGLLAPLVNRSAIEAQFDAAKALQIHAMYNYQKVVLGAYAEVVGSLSRLEAGARITALRRERQAAVAQTVESADALYRAGKASYFEVLLAQQNTLSAELELIEAMKAQHLGAVTLYKALGGGWL